MVENARKVFIVDGSRTPQLKATGRTGPFSASALQSFGNCSMRCSTTYIRVGVQTIPAFPPSMEVN